VNDLREVLRSQAETSSPHADLDGVFQRARMRRRRARVYRSVAVVAVLAVATGALVSTRGHDHPTTVSTAKSPAGLGGVIIGRPPATGLDRHDPGADSGPWSVGVRKADGSLGYHGAVVTYPVNGRVQLRGDVSVSERAAILAGTHIVNGRPVVHPPQGFRVAYSRPYRAPDIHESRYGSADLGEGAALGNGLTYTGLLSAGGFEDHLFNTAPHERVRVGGHDAVVSGVQGGNGTLAWEIEPGVVAYVGYSGSSLGDASIAALKRLAARAQVINARAWASTHQFVANQVNAFG
jgi:hypothetical protein